MRLGIKLPHHAYVLPADVDVGSAARAARMQGGDLCEVRERPVRVRVQEGEPARWVEVDMIEMTWHVIVDNPDRDVPVLGRHMFE